MIDKHIRREMRAIGDSARERAVVNDCGWRDGTSSRKALLIVGDDPCGGGRMLTLHDLHEAESLGLPMTAQAGNGSSQVDIADVIIGYDTDTELPVIFVDEENGEETLSMFLYDMQQVA